jgi:2-hydroxy-3-oxopropionate reductase
MAKIGFIGLGIMGLPMAKNLVTAGHDVTGYNRCQARADALVAAGGRRVSSVAGATEGADIVITMLPDSPDVEAVALGDGGVLDNSHTGQLLIDMSTVKPATSRALAAAAGEHGVRVLDAPVSGGEAGAIDGVLSVMVGGDPEDFEAAQPVLQAVGTTIVHVGPHGAGQTVKAANQLIVAGNIQLLAEALALVAASGVDPEPAVKVLGGGLAGSTVLNRKAGNMLQRDFTPGFRLSLHHKDMGIVTAAARDAGVVIPLGAAVAQLIAALVARGDGNLDHSALFKLTEELSGRTK